MSIGSSEDQSTPAQILANKRASGESVDLGGVGKSFIHRKQAAPPPKKIQAADVVQAPASNEGGNINSKPTQRYSPTSGSAIGPRVAGTPAWKSQKTDENTSNWAK
jgi:hypothetical protein